MNIFLGIMKEELERNLYKQRAFEEELLSLPKGYLSICNIDGKMYVYRKKRENNKIVSEYIGVPDDEKVKEAKKNRDRYLYIKSAIKDLKAEEIRLRKAIKDYVGE